jgi:hypothetical protein
MAAKNASASALRSVIIPLYHPGGSLNDEQARLQHATQRTLDEILHPLGRWQVWDFGQLPAGVAFTVWISWQANPTNPGRHPQDVALYDGGTQLMSVHRTLTVFP